LSAASSISPIARGGFTALLFAAREGDIDSAKAMLDGGVDINYGDIDNTGALTVALMNKQFTFAKFAIERGANLNQIDAYGRTPVYAAVDIRNEDWSTLPNRKGEDSLTALDILKLMTDRGANLNTPLVKALPGRSGMDSGDTQLNEGSTPLLRAARSGDATAMRLLLAKGADAKLTNRDGTNLLLVAAGVGYRDKNTRGTNLDALEAVKVALEAGMDLAAQNSKGETALHGAASRGADPIVQFLVEKGAALNAKTRQGHTPVDVAMGKAVAGQLPIIHESTVALLKKLGGLEAKDVK
jgi:ankyrin repeat protein